MKKVIAILVLMCVVALLFTGCNKQIIDHNYKFNHAIIRFADGDMEIDVKSWRDWDDSDMIQVTSTDGAVYYTHSSNVILMYIPD